jgi:hypothetical protein
MSFMKIMGIAVIVFSTINMFHFPQYAIINTLTLLIGVGICIADVLHKKRVTFRPEKTSIMLTKVLKENDEK